MDSESRGLSAQEGLTNHCDHCLKKFKRSSTLISHQCEPKRRWQDRNTVPVQLALEAYCRFYQHFHPNQVAKDWAHFASSSYYSAFVRFAKYMLDVKCVNTSKFIDYVIQKNIKLDQWARDSVYEQFLLSWSKTEDPWQAIKRSLLVADHWATVNQSQTCDYFRYANANQIILDLDRGQISPWLVLSSNTGINWLSKLNEHQVGLIYKWIDPTVWTPKIQKHPYIDEIRSVLDQVGI